MFEVSSWMFDFIKILLKSLMNQRFEDYNSNFSEISKYVNSKGIVAKYYSSTKGSYKKDNFDIEEFAIRYYRAKKEMYNSSQMLIEAKRNKEVGVYYRTFLFMLLCLISCNAIIIVLEP